MSLDLENSSIYLEKAEDLQWSVPQAWWQWDAALLQSLLHDFPFSRSLNLVSLTSLLLKQSVWNWLIGLKATGKDGDGLTLQKCHHMNFISLGHQSKDQPDMERYGKGAQAEGDSWYLTLEVGLFLLSEDITPIWYHNRTSTRKSNNKCWDGSTSCSFLLLFFCSVL